MRVRGGTAGILSAIDAGRLDELSPDLPDEPNLGRFTMTKASKFARRDKARARIKAKKVASRAPF